MKYIIPFIIVVFLQISVFAGNIDRVEPPFWWTDMKNPDLQLMIHGEAIAFLNVQIDYPGVNVKDVSRLESDNYLFVDLEISSDAKPGNFDLQFFKDGKQVEKATYQLLQRQNHSANRKGFSNADVIYLITPDRFANGDTLNDAVEGMKDLPDRTHYNGRHGGDIQGIIDHLDYIDEMGFTAIWINPMLENNMDQVSYHGYSITDFYKTDPRYGSNELYVKLANSIHQKGLKLIMDMVFNHCGSQHWWMNDLPSEDWINDYPDYKISSHHRTVNQDPHASALDISDMADGWFVPSMPDLNQKNPFMATYLIQNSIWWIEYADLDGIRMDTYPYPDKNMMAEWGKRVLEEYPHFNMVGEEWSLNPAIVSYWQKGKHYQDNYVSFLPSLMDFPLHHAVVRGLLEKKEWGKGFIRIYEMLANDFLYPDPDNLVIFPDNHDMSRFYTQLNEDDGLFRLGITFFLTTRGIPQIFYGTEILMANPNSTEHGVIRGDFPGGWPGDWINAFSGDGLSLKQKTTQEYFKKLLNWRRDKNVMHNGKLLHFAPKDGIYVYFRYDDENVVMIVLNKNKEEKILDTSRFHEVMGDKQTGWEIISEKNMNDLIFITVPAFSPMVIELK